MPQRSFNVFDPKTNERKVGADYAQIQSLASLEKHAAKYCAIELMARRNKCDLTGVENSELQTLRRKAGITLDYWAVVRVNAPELDVRHWRLGQINSDNTGLADHQALLWEEDWRLATEDEELRSFQINAEKKRLAEIEAVAKKFGPGHAQVIAAQPNATSDEMDRRLKALDAELAATRAEIALLKSGAPLSQAAPDTAIEALETAGFVDISEGKGRGKRR